MNVIYRPEILASKEFFAAADNLEKQTAAELCLLLPPLDGAAMAVPELKGIY